MQMKPFYQCCQTIMVVEKWQFNKLLAVEEKINLKTDWK